MGYGGRRGRGVRAEEPKRQCIQAVTIMGVGGINSALPGGVMDKPAWVNKNTPGPKGEENSCKAEGVGRERGSID